MFDINILSCISIDTSEIGEVVIEDETNDIVSIMVKTRPVEKFFPGCGRSIHQRLKIIILKSSFTNGCKIKLWYNVGAHWKGATKELPEANIVW